LVSHLAVAALAAVVTAALAPLVALLSRRLGALEQPPDTGQVSPDRVVPTMGGLAMAAGVLAALGLAWLLPTFAPLFTATSEPLALLVGVVVIVVIGALDDLRPLPPPVKLAGQIVAALGVVVFGVQIVHFWLPGVGIIALSSDLGLPLTVLALVAMINAVNLIDGLDGLAAGVATIAAVAFLLFAGHSQPGGVTSATLVGAIVIGVSVGFLVHNWHPARLYMGDAGSQLLGLLLGVAMISYVGRTTAPSNTDFFGSVPLLVPVLVLAVPFLDSAFAVVRRVLTRRPVTAGDLGHLHHLLLAFGHSHRRAVLVLYYWSGVIAFGSVAPALLPWERLLPWLIVAGALGLVLTALGTRPRRVPRGAAVGPTGVEVPVERTGAG
jgi:UDP-GlcNAc:undecaprenyl-phosphate/decaprenyl-phosphate GlcNAc-1-phosphate transferase